MWYITYCNIQQPEYRAFCQPSRTLSKKVVFCSFSFQRCSLVNFPLKPRWVNPYLYDMLQRGFPNQILRATSGFWLAACKNVNQSLNHLLANKPVQIYNSIMCCNHVQLWLTLTFYLVIKFSRMILFTLILRLCPLYTTRSIWSGPK